MPAFSMKVVTVAMVVSAIFYIFTWIRFRLEVKRYVASTKRELRRPPLFPYALPFAGSTLSFANRNIGQYWQWLLLRCKSLNIDAASILLGGQRTQVIFSPDGVMDFFKARQLSRSEFDQQLGRNALGMSAEDSRKAFPSVLDGKVFLTVERIHSETLLNPRSVDVLTSRFMDLLTNTLDNDRPISTGIELSLFNWTRTMLTKVSLDALAGPRLLEMHPDFPEHFWKWDQGLVGMIIGIPRMFARLEHDAREKALDQIENWLSAGYDQVSTEIKDVDWEPNFGARMMRKRHDYYEQQKMSLRAQAGGDLAFIGGILSNSIPATGWLLLHILSPTNADVRLKILLELKSIRRERRGVNISALMSLPLLNACFYEILRLHTDVVVMRRAVSDAIIGRHIVKSGETVVAPVWMTHRDPDYFHEPEKFIPERFLTQDENTGKLICGASLHSTHYFPFGGGHYMCPGRDFARQEVLSTIAILMLNLDITFTSFVDDKGNELGTKQEFFPTPKRNFTGNPVLDLSGDMRVNIRRRKD